MKFTVADLLDQIPSDQSLTLTKLEKSLGLTLKQDRQQLRIGLDALCRLGLLDERESGLQQRQDDSAIPARLRCSSKGFCFALRDDGGEDIYIRDHQLNHAWNGDRVLVRITREGGRRRSPEGSVLCVLERATSRLLAQLEQHDDQLVAVPLDDRLLTSISLPPGDAQHLQPAEASVVEVLIDRYPVGQFRPQGHVQRQLPVNGGAKADLDLLLTKHGLQDLPAAPRATLRTPAERDRTDLTALPTLLLPIWRSDTAPCPPAVSLERQETTWRLWVHVPTVAERLSPGGSLDLWLRQRAEAFCIGERWLPLLPAALAKASAFTVGHPQAAVSVALELGPDGELLQYRFCRSQIQVNGTADLAALQALAERKPKARTLPAALKPLKEQLPLLEDLVVVTGLLRQRRLAAGSIELDLPPPAMAELGDLQCSGPDADDRGWLMALPDHHPEAILREATLVADRALGRHLAALHLPALFSRNDGADEAAVNEVAKAALALDIPLELSAEGNATATELAAVFAASDRRRVLQLQLRETLEPVLLHAEAAPHALAGEPVAVAPWCFPSRHCSDLWNQQLLVLLLAEGKDRPSVRHKTTVDLGSDTCHGSIDWPVLTGSQLAPFQEGRHSAQLQRLQTRRRLVRDLADDRISLAQARAAEALVGQSLQGVISGVQSYGFFVEVPPSQVEGLVHVSSLKDDWYEYRSRQNRLVGRKNRRTYRLGDPVEVMIEKVDVLRHQIDLAVIEPEGELDPAVADELDDPAGDQDPGEA